MAPYTCRILIVGCGISSLATAIGLRKAGHEVIIFERMTGFPSITAGIQIPPNAARCLKHLEVFDEVRSSAVHPQSIVIRSYRDGKQLSSLPLVPQMEEHYHSPYLVTRRVDLHGVLLVKAKSLGVLIHMGAKVAEVDFTTPSVTLVGGDLYKGDLVLAGDGTNSSTRQALPGGDKMPFHSGDEVVSIAVDANRLRQSPELRRFVDQPAVTTWFGPDAHVVTYPPKSGDLLHIILSRREDRDTPVQIQPREAYLQELKDFFKDWDNSFVKLLNIAERAMKWTLTEIPNLPNWCHPSGLVAVVGDSAHAMLPYLAQGAAQGLEDAACLSVLFAHVRDRIEIPHLLSIYERLRMPRAHETKRRSKVMRDINSMIDGPEQEKRDRELLANELSEGLSVFWSHPEAQLWTFGYDIVMETQDTMRTYRKHTSLPVSNL